MKMTLKEFYETRCQDQEQIITKLRDELIFAWSRGYETGINDPKGGHAVNPYVKDES